MTVDVTIRLVVALGCAGAIVVLTIKAREEKRRPPIPAEHLTPVELLEWHRRRKWRPVSLLGRIVLLAAIGYGALEAIYLGLPTGPRNVLILLGVNWLLFGETMELVASHGERRRRGPNDHPRVQPGH